jgi:hypothetical protein
MTTFYRLAWLSLLLAAGAAHAQGLKPVEVVRTLPGWQCMALASTYGSQGAYAPPAPVYAGPSPSSPQVGTGAGVIIVPDPLRPVDGRTEMIWSSGKKVWIDVKLLTHWHSLSDPAAVCHPALLSNGRYGFTTTG